MSKSWSEYMKTHGAEEYAAWDAAVKPLTDRIAELEGTLNAVVILLRAKTNDATWEKYPDSLKDCLAAEYAELRKDTSRLNRVLESICTGEPWDVDPILTAIREAYSETQDCRAAIDAAMRKEATA